MYIYIAVYLMSGLLHTSGIKILNSVRYYLVTIIYSLLFVTLFACSNHRP